MLLTVVDVQSGIRLTSFARKVAKNRPWSGFDSSLRSLRISVISALNISRDYSNADITEIRRDRREEANSCIKHFSCNARLSKKPTKVRACGRAQTNNRTLT